jgi:hypothetical protein
MLDSLNILHPVKTVAAGGELVEVRELRWPDALAFLQALARQAGQFITPDGRLEFTAETLPRAVRESGALIDCLLTKATGREAAWLQNLAPVDVLALLDAALELNASPELIARGKTLAGRLQTAFASRPAAAPSTSSSPNAAIF